MCLTSASDMPALAASVVAPIQKQWVPKSQGSVLIDTWQHLKTKLNWYVVRGLPHEPKKCKPDGPEFYYPTYWTYRAWNRVQWDSSPMSKHFWTMNVCDPNHLWFFERGTSSLMWKEQKKAKIKLTEKMDSFIGHPFRAYLIKKNLMTFAQCRILK